MKEKENEIPNEEMNPEQECQQKHDNLSGDSDNNQVENDTDLSENDTESTQTEQNDAKEEEKAGEKKKNRSFFGRKKSEDDELKKQLEEAEIKYKELNDRFLRLYSEFDNYKKRTNKEKLELLSTASEKVIVGLLPVIDDFERAIAANEKSEEVTAIKEGFVLIYNKLQQLLKRWSLQNFPEVSRLSGLAIQYGWTDRLGR